MNTTLKACRRIFVKWYPAGCNPHRRHSSQRLVEVNGKKSGNAVVHQM